METYIIRIEGTFPSEVDVNEKADAIIAETAAHLRADGHVVSRISLDHGGLKGGSRMKDFTLKESLNSSEVLSEINEA